MQIHFILHNMLFPIRVLPHGRLVDANGGQMAVIVTITSPILWPVGPMRQLQVTSSKEPMRMCLITDIKMVHFRHRTGIGPMAILSVARKTLITDSGEI